MAKQQQSTKAREIEEVPIDLICESLNNPRVRETAEQLSELMNSINQQGLLQPIIVRKCADSTGGKQLEIISGHRRFWAFIELGRERISCIVRVGVSDSEATEIQFIENLQRADIHPLMEAEAYQRYCADALGLSVLVPSQTFRAVKEIAMKIGKDHTYVMKIMQLIFLTEDAKKLYLANVITIDHATLLAKMTAEKQAEALKFVIKNNYEDDITEKIALDIKEFREWIRDNIDMNLSMAPFDPTDSELIPGVCACLVCHKNSAFNTALFPELNGQSVCNDRICFNAKIAAHVKKQRSISKKEDKQDFTLLSTDYHLSTSDPMYVKGEIRMKGRYVEVKPGKECEHTKKGQFIDGPKKGEVVLVCSYSKCTKHFKQSQQASGGKSQDNYNSPVNVAKREKAQLEEKKKVEFEREFRYDVMTELLGVVPSKLTIEMLRIILHAKVDEWHRGEMTENMIARRHGWEYSEYHDKIDMFIDKAKENVLVSLFYELHYGDFLDVENIHDANRYSEELAECTKQYKLKLDKIRKGTEKRIAGDNTPPAPSQEGNKKKTIKTKKSTK